MNSAIHFKYFAVLASAGFFALPSLSSAQEAVDESRLEEIVVTSSMVPMPRRQVATAVSVVDAEEIELRGYFSVADLLRTQPGISVSNNGGAGKATSLRVRGEEHYRTLLIIDGVKSVDPSAPQTFPDFASLLATPELERVEVLRGPQGFLYGADAGGVVNLMTRTGRGAAGGRVGVEYGADNTRNLDAHVSGGGDRGDYFFSVADFETDGFNAQTADNLLADDDGADNTSVHLKLGWNAGDNLRLQFVGRDVDARAAFDGCGFPTTHDCLAETEQTSYRLSADYDGERLSHMAAYSGTEIGRDNLAGGNLSFATAGELNRFEYTGSYRYSDSAALVYGADLLREEMASGLLRARDQDAYYFEYQGQFGERFFVTAGARYDDNEDFGTHTSARLSGAYLSELGGGRSLKYRASVGTGFRPPSLFEIAYNSGPFAFPPAADASLAEETSAGYDLGVEFENGQGLRAALSYFDQRIEDEIFFDLVGFSGYLQSPGESESTGVEMSVDTAFNDRWSLIANLTFNDTEDFAGRQRLRRPERFGSVGLYYVSVGGDLRVLANLRLSRDAVDIGRIALDDYVVFDVSASYRLSESFELYARVENATDESYQELLGFNTAGRSAYAGFRLGF